MRTDYINSDHGNPSRQPPTPLTNLAHLDWLRVPLTLTERPGHTTYRLAEEPTVDVVWTYAERQPDGRYRRVGGGRYDPATGRYGQGAFNADDVARAAVVYLRHWQATGAGTSRRAAYGLLRGLAYLQTVLGAHAGNVVLWMQSDGALQPSADPSEQPDPSDSGESCWLARTIWAFGEGYAAFRDTDPPFADFLQQRIILAIAAVERQSLARYGQWLAVDGALVPAWLLNQGADMAGEALLGLAPYVEASADPRARVVLDRLAEGVAAMGGPANQSWPYGAIMPNTWAPRLWHAWAGLAPAGLARAYRINRSAAARDAALVDAAAFTPLLLVAAGPRNSWTPDSADEVQIAYGAHSRVESLLAVAEHLHRPGLVALAGVAASWFLGNNPAGMPMYDPATGRTHDGVDPPGVRNGDAGAESTVHGLLAMLALDANPHAAAIARAARPRDRHVGIPSQSDHHDDHRRSPVPERGLAWLVLEEPGTRHAVVLVRNLAASPRRVALVAPADGSPLRVYDPTGRVLGGGAGAGPVRHVELPGCGFALLSSYIEEDRVDRRADLTDAEASNVHEDQVAGLAGSPGPN